ncbi:MAG: DNA-binding transcriptional LysR family regulator [Glaciecola sp.]|jgi:DNA-binding transcriptional LysR family regulator
MSRKPILREMEIRQPRHLVAAIDEKSLIRSFEAAFITQPALARSLQNIEHELCAE